MDNFKISNKQDFISKVDNEYQIEFGEDYFEFLSKYLDLFSLENTDDFKEKFKDLIKNISNNYSSIKKSTLLFSIEGTTGIGKSTWIKKLGNIPDAIFLTEPVIAWTSIVNERTDETIYELFFKSISIQKSINGIIFKFQSMVHFSKWLLHTIIKCKQDKDIFIAERSIFSDWAYFEINNQYFSDSEKEIYTFIEDTLCENCPKQNVCLLYLTCDDDTNVCLNRINKRNRPGEEEISKEYVNKISSHTKKLYDEWKFNKLCISTYNYADKFNKFVEMFIKDLIQRFSNDGELKIFYELTISEN